MSTPIESHPRRRTRGIDRRPGSPPARARASPSTRSPTRRRASVSRVAREIVRIRDSELVAHGRSHVREDSVMVLVEGAVAYATGQFGFELAVVTVVPEDRRHARPGVGEDARVRAELA